MTDDIFDQAERIAAEKGKTPEAVYQRASFGQRMTAARVDMARGRVARTVKATHTDVGRLKASVSGYKGPKGNVAQKQVIKATTHQAGDARPQPTFVQRDAPGIFDGVGPRGGLFDRPVGRDLFERRRK